MSSLTKYFTPKAPILSPKDAYDLWAESYALESNPIKMLSDESVTTLLPDMTGKAVLDIGCGTGFFCRKAWDMRASRVVGLDISGKMIDRASILTPQTEFHRIETSDYPLLEESFDVAISALVIGHIQSVKATFQEIHRVLRKNGTLIITDFHSTAASSGMKRTFEYNGQIYVVEHHIHTLEIYKEKLAQSGFRIDRVLERSWNNTPVVLALKVVRE